MIQNCRVATNRSQRLKIHSWWVKMFKFAKKCILISFFSISFITPSHLSNAPYLNRYYSLAKIVTKDNDIGYNFYHVYNKFLLSQGKPWVVQKKNIRKKGTEDPKSAHLCITDQWSALSTFVVTLWAYVNHITPQYVAIHGVKIWSILTETPLLCLMVSIGPRKDDIRFIFLIHACKRLYVSHNIPIRQCCDLIFHVYKDTILFVCFSYK